MSALTLLTWGVVWSWLLLCVSCVLCSTPTLSHRCKAEARYASSTANNTLANDLQTAYDRCQELSPVLDDAVDAEDLSGIRSVQRELLQLQGAMEGSIRAAKPPANVRKWLQVGVWRW